MRKVLFNSVLLLTIGALVGCVGFSASAHTHDTSTTIHTEPGYLSAGQSGDKAISERLPGGESLLGKFHLAAIEEDQEKYSKFLLEEKLADDGITPFLSHGPADYFDFTRFISPSFRNFPHISDRHIVFRSLRI